MAVEASHLNVFSPQLIPNRAFVYSNQGNVMGFNNSQMGSSGAAGVPLMNAVPENLLPLHQSLLRDNSLQPKTSMNTDSGLTYNVPVPRKRSRDSFEQFVNAPSNFAAPMKNTAGEVPHFSSFVGERILPEIQQYQMDIDSIISQHTKKIRLELEERQKQHARLLVAAIGEGMIQKLQEKDEQIHRMGKWNLALQERVKSLYVENQLWRDLAQTNEATANSLRANLEQVLAHVSDERLLGGEGAAAVEDDAESCCGSSDYGRVKGKQAEEEAVGDQLPEEQSVLAGQAPAGGLLSLAHDKECGNNNYCNSRMCRMCGEKESCVLLLPCRHLCLCTICGSTLLQSCPVCNSTMNATVHVNMSS